MPETEPAATAVAVALSPELERALIRLADTVRRVVWMTLLTVVFVIGWSLRG